MREGAVQTPCTDEHAPGERVIFATGFATADGRGHVQPLRFHPGPEQPDPDYPFVLTTGRVLEHWHTGAMTRRAHVLDQLAPEAEIAMHPLDADALGLTEDAPVTVVTRHGAVTARLHVSPGVRRGQLFLPFAYWEAAANRLTGSALDPVGKIPGFKVTAARIETPA